MSAFRPAGRFSGGRKTGLCYWGSEGGGGGLGGWGGGGRGEGVYVGAGGGGETDWCMGEEVLKVQRQHEHRQAMASVQVHEQ